MSLKKPEEYRSEFALAMVVAVGMSDETEGFDIDKFMAVLLDKTIARVQRDTVEACQGVCNSIAADEDYSRSEARIAACCSVSILALLEGRKS